METMGQLPTRGHPSAARNRRLRRAWTGVLAVAVSLMSLPGHAAGSGDETDGSTPISIGALGRVAAEDILLRSGAGVVMVPPPEMIEALMDDGVPADQVVPTGATLLQAVFRLAEDAEVWSRAVIEDKITPAGQATAILTGLALGQDLIRTGQAPDSARARLHLTAAKAQADWALVNLVTDGGLVSRTGESTEPAPPSQVWLLLQALSELATATATDGPLGDPAFVPWFGEGASTVYSLSRDVRPETVEEISFAIRAFASYGGLAAAEAGVRDRIAAMVEAMPPPSGPIEQALAVRALSAAYAATTDAGYLVSAEDFSQELLAGLDLTDGAIPGTQHLSVWEVAHLFGALGDAMRLETVAAEAKAAVGTMAGNLILRSGLMPAIPSAGSPFAPGPGLDAVPGSPLPADDKRWAFGAALDYDAESGRWEVADSSVDLPGALYASAQLIALDEIPVGGLGEAESTSARYAGGPSAAPSVVVVEATDFAFSPSTLSLAEGEEIVLRIVNKGSVEHNISIPPLGLSLTASPGEAVETRLIVPEPSRAGAFTCTLPGHAEAGMTGEIRIEADASTSASPPPVPDRIEFDETSGTPSLITAGVLALGMFLGMMAIVFGLLQFMKLEEQR